MIKNSVAPLIPVSWGELIDKVTILEIKKINISSPESLLNINKELSYLNQILFDNGDEIQKIKKLKESLFDVNKKLWIIEDEIREKEYKKEFDSIFIQLARSVYQRNDERAELKKAINKLMKSELKEEKSYKKYK